MTSDAFMPRHTVWPPIPADRPAGHWWNPVPLEIDSLQSAGLDVAEAIAGRDDPPWKKDADELVRIFTQDLSEARGFFLRLSRRLPNVFTQMSRPDDLVGYILRKLVYLAADGQVIRDKDGPEAILAMLALLNLDHLSHPSELSRLLDHFRNS